MQTNNVTECLGLNQWMPGDKLNTGQFTEDNALLDAAICRILGLLVPTSTIIPYAGQPDINKDPPGFLFLTPGGREVSRTTYAALFAVIGTTYGSGNGTTTFKLPDLADRVPLGYSANLTIIGETVGEEKHAMIIAENAPHVHETLYKDPASTGTVGAAVAKLGNNYIILPSYTSGAGQPHNNMQPSLVLAYIIKI